MSPSCVLECHLLSKYTHTADPNVSMIAAQLLALTLSNHILIASHGIIQTTAKSAEQAAKAVSAETLSAKKTAVTAPAAAAVQAAPSAPAGAAVSAPAAAVSPIAAVQQFSNEEEAAPAVQAPAIQAPAAPAAAAVAPAAATGGFSNEEAPPAVVRPIVRPAAQAAGGFSDGESHTTFLQRFSNGFIHSL
jgi:hypothetical protein